MIDHTRRSGDAWRLRVAARAPGEGLAFGPSPEMAQETGALRDRDVISLHDLRVAARAPQLFAAPKSREVMPMIEPHAEKRQLALQLASRVASGTQARRVLDLSPRLSPVRARDVLHDLVRRLHFAHRLRFDPRGVVALDAGHVMVRGGRPGIVVRLHVVAIGAEAGLRRVIDETHRTDTGQQD
jgi:hypothetical protein